MGGGLHLNISCFEACNPPHIPIMNENADILWQIVLPEMVLEK